MAPPEIDLFEEQGLLFQEDQLISDHINYLNIIYNGQPLDATDKLILFDSEKYDTLIGTTFSVGDKFLRDLIREFETVELLVGISDYYYQNKLRENIATDAMKKSVRRDLIEKEGLKLFEELTQKERDRIILEQVRLLAPLPGITIHSKFYLLKNQETQETRVIIGSANLSTQAFSKNVQQFEEILVFDNHELYDVFEARFNKELKPFTTDYIPEGVKRKYNEEGRPKIFLLNHEEIRKIGADEFNKNIERVDVIKYEVTSLADIPEDIRREKFNSEKKTEDDYEAIEIIKTGIGNKGKQAVYPLSTDKVIEKAILTRRQVKITQANTSTDKQLQRPVLIRDDDLHEKQYEGYMVKPQLDKEYNKVYKPYNEFITDEEITESIHLIDEMMRSYQENLEKSSPYSLSRIYEVILYSFTFYKSIYIVYP